MRYGTVSGEVVIGLGISGIAFLAPYLAPGVGALSTYVYLFWKNKIEYSTVDLLISVWIGAVLGCWVVDIFVHYGMEKELSGSIGGIIGILSPQIMAWLTSGEAFKAFLKRILK